MQEEFLDLVDKNDIVIGKEKRSEIYRQGLSNYRVISLFIKNSKGQLWIPRRTANKEIYPLSLDFSVAGHVESGETYEDTLAREVKEEVNINISEIPFTERGYFAAGEDGLSSFMKIYEIQSDENPRYNTDDFVDYYWLTPPGITTKNRSGRKDKRGLTDCS